MKGKQLTIQIDSVEPEESGYESDELHHVQWSYDAAGVGAYFPEEISSKLEDMWKARGESTPEAPVPFTTPDGRDWLITVHTFQMLCPDTGEILEINRHPTSPSAHHSDSYTPDHYTDQPLMPPESQLFRKQSENEWTPDEVAKLMNEMRDQIANLSMAQMDDKVTWAYTDEEGKTHAYPAEFCSLLEILLNTRTSKEKETPYISKNGETCVVDLSKWEHRVLSTGAVYQVKRKYKERQNNQQKSMKDLFGGGNADLAIGAGAAPNLLSDDNEELWEPDDVEILSKEMRQEMMKLSLMLKKKRSVKKLQLSPLSFENKRQSSRKVLFSPNLDETPRAADSSTGPSDFLSPRFNQGSPLSQMSANLYTWDEEDSWDPDEVGNIQTEISVDMSRLAEMLIESDSEDWDPSRDNTPSDGEETDFGRVGSDILSEQEEEVLAKESNNLCRGSDMNPDDVHKLAQEMKLAMDKMALEKAEEVEWFFMKNGKENLYPESFAKILEVLKAGRRKQNSTPYVDGSDTCIIDLKLMIHTNLVTGEVWPVRRRVKKDDIKEPSFQIPPSPRNRKQQLVDGMKAVSRSMASLFVRRKSRTTSVSR